MAEIRNGAIKLVIDSSLENVWMVGIAVRHYSLAAGYTDDSAMSIELALVEAVNNAIIHAYKSQAGRRIEITVELFPPEMVFTITDYGAGLDKLPNPNMEFDLENVLSLPEGGYGLHIIHQVMDKIEYYSKDNHNVLIMRKAFL